MIKTLFFDLGSTLIDESLCYEQRIAELLKQDGAPSETAIRKRMKENAMANRLPYLDTVSDFGLRKTPWVRELERLYPDVPEILERLSKRYSLGIIANQNFGGAERLKSFGILKYFNTVVLSAEEGVAKPDPDIFRIAMQREKCAPKECIMIGDRLDNDILPAQKLGMYTVWVRQGTFYCADPVSMGCTPTASVLNICESESAVEKIASEVN